MAWLGCDSYQNLNHPARTRAMAKGTFQNENVHFWRKKQQKSFSTVNQFSTNSEKLIPNIQKHILLDSG